MLDRIIGVLKLDSNTYEEIEHDKGATMQAGIVVVVVAILSGLGTFLSGGNIIVPLIGAIVGWVLWSAITFFVGTKVFGGKADLGEMLRVIGFATAPNALGVLSFIPVLGVIIGIVAGIWSLATGFVAVRQGLDLDNVKSLITVVIGFIVYIILASVLGALTGLGV